MIIKYLVLKMDSKLNKHYNKYIKYNSRAHGVRWSWNANLFSTLPKYNLSYNILIGILLHIIVRDPLYYQVYMI